MLLSAKLAQKFSSTTRKRGQDYYREMRVEIQRGSDSEVEACVSGSQVYDVDVNWSDGKLSVWCECHYYVDSGFPCKHLWATILAAEARGYLSAAAAAADLLQECDFVDGDAGFDARGPRVPLIALRAPVGVARPAHQSRRFGGDRSARSSTAARLPDLEKGGPPDERSCTWWTFPAA